MHLEKLSLRDIAAELDEPFSMVDIASVGDLTVSLYLCQGALEWHRHLDQDELFWVHRGMTLLQTERGEAHLQQGELAVVPKGLAHRTSSSLGSTVILMRCTTIPDRKNGRLRLYGTGERGPTPVNLSQVAQEITAPLQLRTVARVEDTAVQVAYGGRHWPISEPPPHDILLVVLAGEARVYADANKVLLQPEDLTVIPRGTPYRLETSDEALIAFTTRQD